MYNLCCETSARSRYSPSVFDGRMSVYSMPDHAPPKFAIIEEFCKDVQVKMLNHIDVCDPRMGKGRKQPFLERFGS